MELKEQLKESTCNLCHDARDEIIRLEAEIISLNKMARRLFRPSKQLLNKLDKASMGAAGRALCREG